MAIDPAAHGLPSPAHMPLPRAGEIARLSRPAVVQVGLQLQAPERTPGPLGSVRSAPAPSQRNIEPHTPVRSSSTGPLDPGRWDGMLNRLGKKYNVPPMFLKAVMLVESAGDPNAVGDSGASVGLFQLHERGYGYGMGDTRFDPETNADRAARGLAEAWQAGQRAGYSGEFAVRAAYDYSFNPGGGFAYQGDKLVTAYNRLLREQGLPELT